MELEEIKAWAEQHIPDYNMRTAFTLILEIIYGETDDKVEDIEKFYKWFKEKWNECSELVNKKNNFHEIINPLAALNGETHYFHDMSFPKTLRLFYNTHIKNLFKLNDIKTYCVYPSKKYKTKYNKIVIIACDFIGIGTLCSYDDKFNIGTLLSFFK